MALAWVMMFRMSLLQAVTAASSTLAGLAAKLCVNSKSASVAISASGFGAKAFSIAGASVESGTRMTAELRLNPPTVCAAVVPHLPRFFSFTLDCA